MGGRTPGSVASTVEERQRAAELREQGWSLRQIGAEVGRSSTTVSRWLEAARPAASRDATSHASVDDAFAEAEIRAAGVLVELAEDAGAPPSVRLRAALAILDRRGHIPPRRSDPPEDEPPERPDLSEVATEELDRLWELRATH